MVILQGAWFQPCGRADRRGSGIVTRISFWSEGSCCIDHLGEPVRSGGPAQTYGLRSPRHSGYLDQMSVVTLGRPCAALLPRGVSPVDSTAEGFAGRRVTPIRS